MKLTGLYPATVTPFTEDNAVDVEELGRHIARVADHAGVSGVVVNGHAGEISMLSWQERADVVRAAKPATGGKPLFAGIEAFSSMIFVWAAGLARYFTNSHAASGFFVPL